MTQQWRLSPYDSRITVQSLVDTLVLPENLPDVEQIRVASYNVRNLFGETPDAWTTRTSEPIDPERAPGLTSSP